MASPSSAAEAPPAIQERPVSGGTQSQDDQTAVGPCPAALHSQRAGGTAHSGTGSDEAQKVIPTGSPLPSRQSPREAQRDQ